MNENFFFDISERGTKREYTNQLVNYYFVLEKLLTLLEILFFL